MTGSSCFRPFATAALMAGLLLAACQTGKNEAYEVALRANDDQAPAERAKSAETAADPTAPGPQHDSAPGERRPLYDRFDVETIEPAERPSDSGSIEAGVWLMADKRERRIRSSGNRITDPALNTYLQDVVCRVAGEYCADLRVYVSRVPAFNASMAPNGTMVIWSGLLLRVHNEAQLAAVIGHEIGHYLRRHTMQRARDMVERANGMLLVGVMAGMAGVPSLADLVSTLSTLERFAFSRAHEREADGYGIVLLHEAGYDPRAASKPWEAVMAENEIRDAEAPVAAYSTHPPLEERADMLDHLADELVARSEDAGATGRRRFLEKLWGFRREFLMDEIEIGHVARVHFLLDRMIARGEDLAAAHYYRGELLRRTGLRDPGADEHSGMDDDARERAALEGARDAYRRALAADGRPPPSGVYKGLGVVLRKLGSADAADRMFETYLDRVPDARDRELIRMMISTEVS